MRYHVPRCQAWPSRLRLRPPSDRETHSLLFKTSTSFQGDRDNMSKGKDPKESAQTSVQPTPLHPHGKLPTELQKLLDDDDSLLDQIYDGTYVIHSLTTSLTCSYLSCSANATTDSNIRYAAYATRFRTILLSAQRYVAYTSDIGESFRPVAHPWLVRGAYGVSWAYLIGDVGHEGYKAYLKNRQTRYPIEPGVKIPRRAWDARSEKDGGPPPMPEPGHVPAIDDYRSVMVQRAIFQSLASMGLPAFTIHSIVKYSGKALKDARNTRIRTYGPIGVRRCLIFVPDICSLTCIVSLAWLRYPSYLLFSTSLSKILSNGAFIKHLRPF